MFPLTNGVNVLLSYAIDNAASVNSSNCVVLVTFAYTTLSSISVIPAMLSNTTWLPLTKPCRVVVVTIEGVAPVLTTMLATAFC